MNHQDNALGHVLPILSHTEQNTAMHHQQPVMERWSNIFQHYPFRPQNPVHTGMWGAGQLTQHITMLWMWWRVNSKSPYRWEGMMMMSLLLGTCMDNTTKKDNAKWARLGEIQQFLHSLWCVKNTWLLTSCTVFGDGYSIHRAQNWCMQHWPCKIVPNCNPIIPRCLQQPEVVGQFLWWGWLPWPHPSGWSARVRSDETCSAMQGSRQWACWGMPVLIQLVTSIWQAQQQPQNADSFQHTQITIPCQWSGQTHTKILHVPWGSIALSFHWFVPVWLGNGVTVCMLEHQVPSWQEVSQLTAMLHNGPPPPPPHNLPLKAGISPPTHTGGGAESFLAGKSITQHAAHYNFQDGAI